MSKPSKPTTAEMNRKGYWVPKPSLWARLFGSSSPVRLRWFVQVAPVNVGHRGGDNIMLIVRVFGREVWRSHVYQPRHDDGSLGAVLSAYPEWRDEPREPATAALKRFVYGIPAR